MGSHYQDQQLPGHGTDYHHEGFGSPVGYLKDSDKALEDFSDSDLAARGIKNDTQCKITFTSGIEVNGIVREIHKRDDKIQLIQFSDCAVKDQNGELLFRPEWGVYDMAVGEKIVSVFAGTADKEKFNVLPPKSEETAIKVVYYAKEKHLFAIYQQLSDMREKQNIAADQAEQLFSDLIEDYPDEWLAYLELLEILKKNNDENTLQDRICRQLEVVAERSDEKKKLIADGLDFLN